ncbi:hypothetical protein [Mycoplasma miroungirhinis]|uniref:Uncharacterized protein n=1 Tax=Mycoplasma miroungirhinis TaxID=754516 RepID=A0A6M4JCC3_9MOLU|nr:hypothetical protein [Mycoplasma miroungirhinis]QJR43995.1 hypothetical protein HLA92_00860 [Mycoplasma miroungirhinis]
MERKIIVVIKEFFKKFTICAFESINGDFQTIFSHSINKHQDQNNIINMFQNTLEEIKNITKGDVQNIIYSIEDPNSFYISKLNLNCKNIPITFDHFNLNTINHQLTKDTIDFLAYYQANDIKAIKHDNTILYPHDFKSLPLADLKSLEAVVSRYFIKQQAYKYAQNLINKLSLNIEKMIIGFQLENLYISNVKSQDNKILIKILEDNVLLSFVTNNIIQETKILQNGINILIHKLANILNITSYEARCLIANYNYFEENLQQPFLFRKDKSLQVINDLIKNFYLNISHHITCMLKLYNNLDFSQIQFEIIESQILNLTTSKQLLHSLHPNNEIKTIYDYKLPIYKYINFNNWALVNYLKSNISDQDITNTYTINTQTIENIKFKKPTIFKNFIKRIFAM